MSAEDANPASDRPALTRRQLREQRMLVPAPVEQAAPLTRRELREREIRERERQAELRAEELATLEIAELGSGPLEPQVELTLEPVVETGGIPAVAEWSPASGVAVDVPLHIAPAPATPAPAPAPAETTPTRRSQRADLRTSGAPVETGVVVPAFGQRALLPASQSSARRAAAQPPARRGSNAPRAAASGAASARSNRSKKRGGWAKAGVSGIAMAFVLAITAVTALPSTVSASPVDANVVNLSLNAKTSAATQQLITASGSSSTVDRDGYAVADAGELQAAGYSTAQLLVGRSLAQELVNAMDSGKLVGSTPDHLKEIRWIAEGTTVPDCGIDYRILEIIAIAVRNFDQVGVSDINRKCTGQIEGGGTSSMHYVDGGGHAVDFYLLNNQSLNGADANTLRMISLLDPVMPVGSRVGQAGCRAGVAVQLTNWTQFDDSCTHMHIDVPVTDAPLLLSDNDDLLAGQ